MTDWIVVPNWSRFQHYTNRNPPWIKNYRDLLHKPEYVDLPLAARGLLHGIWLAYAEWDGRLTRRDALWTVGEAHTTRTQNAQRMFESRALAQLNDAGFVGFSASKPLSLSLDQVPARARANGTAPAAAPAPCPECGVGAGLHTADCPSLRQLQLLDFTEGGRT